MRLCVYIYIYKTHMADIYMDLFWERKTLDPDKPKASTRCQPKAPTAAYKLLAETMEAQMKAGTVVRQ